MSRAISGVNAMIQMAGGDPALRQLEVENRKLKQLVADLMLR